MTPYENAVLYRVWFGPKIPTPVSRKGFLSDASVTLRRLYQDNNDEGTRGGGGGREGAYRTMTETLMRSKPFSRLRSYCCVFLSNRALYVLSEVIFFLEKDFLNVRLACS